MANSHFAKLGDVWKHLPLAEVLHLNPPLEYWETHAGSASYPLTVSAERSHGAIRFLEHAPDDPDLSRCRYLSALNATPGTYPGSAALAISVLGRGASYVFCDTDEVSAQSLRQVGAGFDVEVVNADGVSAVHDHAQRRRGDPSGVVVHIDPFLPNERRSPRAQTPIELAASLARRGFRVFYWYGSDPGDEPGWAHTAIARLAPSIDLWCGELVVPAPFVYDGRAGAWGCGIVLANASTAEIAACERLGVALERMGRGDRCPGNAPEHTTFTIVA